MFTSKIVKKICYTILILELIAAVVMIVLGIEGVIKKEAGGALLLIIGIVLPIVALLSIYPTLALTNIDENLQELNEKVDDIISKNNSNDVKYSAPQRVYTNNRSYSNTQNSYSHATKTENIVHEDNANKVNYQPKNEIDNNAHAVKVEHKERNSSEILVQYMADSNVIDFINQKYSTNIEPDDEIDTIKHKVSNILDNSTPASILKVKVSRAKNVEEIISIFNMHKTIYE